MRYVAAYLLAALGGNESPSAADIKGILSSVGIEADDARLNTVIDQLKGKSIEDVLKEGSEKLAAVPTGGAGGAAAGGAAAGGDAGAAAAEPEPEPEEEESEEDMGFGLFD